MAKKTFKIGEYAKGGIIAVETKGQIITVIGKEWDFSTGSRRSSDQTNAKEWCRKEFNADSSDVYRELYMYLSDLTTHYYAETVIDWIKTKVTLSKNYFY